MQTVTILLVLFLVGHSGWVVFERAGERGWLALIPGVNAVVAARIAGAPLALAVVCAALCWVPMVGYVASAVLFCMLSRTLGCRHWLVVGLGISVAPWIFGPVLAGTMRTRVPEPAAAL